MSRKFDQLNGVVIYTHREVYRGYLIECFRDGERHGAKLAPADTSFMLERSSCNEVLEAARDEVDARYAKRA